MSILESFAQIPLMLYLALLLMPLALYGYFRFSKPVKSIAAAAANPADQLRDKKINLRREFLMALFLSGCIGLAAVMLISFGGIIDDYKNNRGLFATPLPAATLPPSQTYVFPPAPVVNSTGTVPTK